MATAIMELMPNTNNDFQEHWRKQDKILIRGSIPQDLYDFVEKRAFEDFGMMKKGAIGMELTILLEIARKKIEEE